MKNKQNKSMDGGNPHLHIIIIIRRSSQLATPTK